MLSTPSADCSTIEPRPFHAGTDAGLMRCASRRWRRNEGGLTVTLDGVTLEPSGYVGATRAFGFTMPAQNNFLHLTGQSRGRMAVFGAASILRPLRPGMHTLVQAFSYAHTSIYVKVTYRLTVG
jgi:hypothetical protein